MSHITDTFEVAPITEWRLDSQAGQMTVNGHEYSGSTSRILEETSMHGLRAVGGRLPHVIIMNGTASYLGFDW